MPMQSLVILLINSEISLIFLHLILQPSYPSGQQSVYGKEIYHNCVDLSPRHRVTELVPPSGLPAFHIRVLRVVTNIPAVIQTAYSDTIFEKSSGLPAFHTCPSFKLISLESLVLRHQCLSAFITCTPREFVQLLWIVLPLHREPDSSHQIRLVRPAFSSPNTSTL